MKQLTQTTLFFLINDESSHPHSAQELQGAYEEFTNALTVESFAESQYVERYNVLTYTHIELQILQAAVQPLYETKKKCAHANLFKQVSVVC